MSMTGSLSMRCGGSRFENIHDVEHEALPALEAIILDSEFGRPFGVEEKARLVGTPRRHGQVLLEVGAFLVGKADEKRMQAAKCST